MIKLTLLSSLGVVLAGAVTWLFGIWPFDGPEIPPVPQEVVIEASQAATVDTALKMMQDAIERLDAVKDYRCTYLRDEFIDGKLHENHLHLAIRHTPFSVRMEWLAPKEKTGRVTNYVTGRNDGKMIVKEPVIKGLPPIKLHLDPDESKKRKESRHVITEAGLRNAMERCYQRWEKDRGYGVTQVTLQDAELIVALPEHEVTLICQCVALTRPLEPDQRQNYDFYRVSVFFDKATGLPVRFETYDWPEPGHDVGRLVERYTYLDVRSNVGLKDADFE
jgi:hypothetical protein